MSEILLERRPEDFTRPVGTIGTSLTVVGCMDDRHLRADFNPWGSQEATEVTIASGLTEYDPSLQPDIQSAAGFHGIVRDAAMAMAIMNGGNLPLGARTPDVIAQTSIRRIRTLGVLAVRHQECAGDSKAQAATQNMADAANGKGIVDEVLWAAAQQIHPAITEEHFVFGALAAGKMIEHRQLPSQKEAELAMEAEEDRAPLILEDHSSGDFIADWRENRGFHTRDAREAGQPAYYANFASTARLMYELSDVLPVSEPAFHAAMAMRHAALVTKHLPHPEGPQGQFSIRHIA